MSNPLQFVRARMPAGYRVTLGAPKHARYVVDVMDDRWAAIGVGSAEYDFNVLDRDDDSDDGWSMSAFAEYFGLPFGALKWGQPITCVALGVA